MKILFGSEEQKYSNLKPKVEIPPELRRKLQKEQKRSAKRREKHFIKCRKNQVKSIDE